MTSLRGQPAVDVFSAPGAQVGESPVWLADRNELMWIDMPSGLLHRTRYEAKGRGGPTQTRSEKVAEFASFAIPRRTDGLVLGTATAIVEVDTTRAVRAHTQVLDSKHRLNDAKCDRSGNLWFGTTAYDFSPGQGALHILRPDWSVITVLEGLALPNGMDWSPDGSVYYLADSITHEVLAFDVSPVGGLSRKRRLYQFTSEEGMPDGLCVDSNGCLWVALWGGGVVAQLSPHGDRLRDLQLDATQPSSCTFGGKALDILFVTSATSELQNPHMNDGAVFAIDGLGAIGLSGNKFAG